MSDWLKNKQLQDAQALRDIGAAQKQLGNAYQQAWIEAAQKKADAQYNPNSLSFSPWQSLKMLVAEGQMTPSQYDASQKTYQQMLMQSQKRYK